MSFSIKKSDVDRKKPQYTFEGKYLSRLLELAQNADHYTVSKIEEFVARNKDNFSGSQLRQLFNKIQRADKKDIPLLRAKLAYAKARKPSMNPLIKVLEEMMQSIDDTPESDMKLKSLKAFMESIICYFAVYGDTKS